MEKLPGGATGVKCPPVRGNPIGDREHDDEQQAEVLRDRREVLHERAGAHAHVVERRGDHDRQRRDVVDVVVVRRDGRIEAEHAHEILGERRGDRAERRRANDRQLRPAEEKRRQPAERLVNEDEDAARVGKRAGHFGQRQRAAQREHSARHPHAHQRQRPGQPVGDAGRRAEDPGADRRADDDGDGAPEAELSRQRRSGVSESSRSSPNGSAPAPCGERRTKIAASRRCRLPSGRAC